LNAVKKILTKNIWLKISFFNSFAVVARVISSWVVNKIIAVYIGPEGTSMTEQFRNFLQTVQGVSTLGIGEGVTRYTAKYQNNKKQLSSFLATSYKIVLITSILFSIGIIVFSKNINHHLFGERDFNMLIILAGILTPIYAINIILLSILNGFQKYKKITYINILTNISVAIFAYYLIVNYYLYGALLLVLITQVIMFIIVLLLIKSDMIEVLQFSLGKSKNSHYKRLINYISMALVTAIIIPLFSILIRNQIFDFFQNDQGVHAGYWDGVKKVSGLFLAFITPIFSLYFYPQLAKITTNKEYFTELKKFYKQIFPLFTIGMIVLYLLRHWAVLLFFSEAYTPMEDLFYWQLLGDFVRVISLTIAFLMLAKAKVTYYISTEIGFWVVYYFLTQYFMQIYDLEGVTIAYFVTYLLYFVSLLFLYRRIFTKKTVLL